jgi:hypothetical protein
MRQYALDISREGVGRVVATREGAKSSVRALLDDLKEWLTHNTPRLSEADTKAGLIDKYIAALGYREFLDIQREYPVKGTQERIDYVLKDKGRPILAVELWPLQHDLSNSKAAAQLVQYCSVEGIEWCALTNGIELRLYNQFLQQPLDGKLVFKLNLLDYSSDAEFDALFDHLWLLSRESMTTPTGLRAWMEHQQIDKEFRSVLLDTGSPPVEYLQTMMAQRGQNVSTEAISSGSGRNSQVASPSRNRRSSGAMTGIPRLGTSRSRRPSGSPIRPAVARTTGSCLLAIARTSARWTRCACY